MWYCIVDPIRVLKRDLRVFTLKYSCSSASSTVMRLLGLKRSISVIKSSAELCVCVCV
jgi:myosin-crossreactive antigen